MTSSSDEEAATLLPAALNIASQWSALPPEHLREALKALEPQLAREHELRVRAQDARQQRMAVDADREKARAEAELEKVRADAASTEARQKRAHVYRMSGLAAGLTISVAMLVAAVQVASEAQWLSVVFAGPGLVALVKIFVLMRSDPDDIRQVARAARDASAAAAPPTAPTGGPVV